MQETRYAVVDGEEIPVLLSDENEALLAAKAAGRAIVGLWREDTQGDEWCAADTLIADVENADEEFLERIARRHLGLPWAICETDRLKIREIAEGDYEKIVENHVDFTKSRNLIIAAVILVSGLGFSNGLTFTVGGTSITLTSLAIAALAGVILNAILPGNDYSFGEDPKADRHRGIDMNPND